MTHAIKQNRHRHGGFIRTVVLVLLPMLVIAAGIMGAVHIYRTGPKAERRKPPQFARLVEVVPLERTTVNTTIQGMGTVIAAQEIVLQPRVSGEVVRFNPKFVPGGRLAEGEFILQIDPADYQLAVERARGDVARAEYELKLEQGQQEIAEHEWNLLGNDETASDLDRELALRKPHLAKAQAALKAAQAALREAQLDLERTTITAPFNCIVMSDAVDLGAQVTPQSQLGTLTGTDEYWVRASIPVDELQWIRFPTDDQPGSTVSVYQQANGDTRYHWTGHVSRVLGDLEAKGRMARVLVAVGNPLKPHDGDDNSGVPLLIGAYVNVSIHGEPVEDVITLPRAALRDGRRVWIMNEQDQLEIRDVSMVWANRDTVLIDSGIESGERLIVSDLPAPVGGMALTLGSPTDSPSTADDNTAPENEDTQHAQAG